MHMTTHNTIIFDFDGTLIDSAPGILATYAAVLKEAGVSPVAPLDQTLIGPPLGPTMLRLIGIEREHLLPILVERFKQLYREIGISNTPAYPSADSTLEQLQRNGVRLFLATNKRAEATISLLNKFSWGHYFDDVYCIDSCAPPFENKKEMLAALLKNHNLKPTSAIYVGDTYGDFIAASSNGIPFAAALWGYEKWDSHFGTPAMQQSLASLTSLLI